MHLTMDEEEERRLAELQKKSLLLLYQLQSGQSTIQGMSQRSLGGSTGTSQRSLGGSTGTSQRSLGGSTGTSHLNGSAAQYDHQLSNRSGRLNPDSSHTSAANSNHVAVVAQKRSKSEQARNNLTRSSGISNGKSPERVFQDRLEDWMDERHKNGSFDGGHRSSGLVQGTSSSDYTSHLSHIDPHALSSTPMGTPPHSTLPRDVSTPPPSSLNNSGVSMTTNLNGTPRSILKRRKLIDDNIHVESKFPPTPKTGTTPVRGHSRGLNYSYSDAAAIDTRPDMDAPYSVATNGSYLEEVPSPHADVDHRPTTSDIEQMLHERLLLNDGNDRKNAPVIRDLSSRPKSVVFDVPSPPDTGPHPAKILATSHSANESQLSNRSTQNTSHHHSNSSFDKSSSFREKTRSAGRPFLGYDWIAGNLENEGTTLEHTDDFFDDIKYFRQLNRSECQGEFSRVLSSNSVDLTRPISPEISDPGHKCIHGFTINDRLFTEPLNSDDEGRSVCTICLAPRTNPSLHEPGFVRVSIPRSTLAAPYRLRPHRRSSLEGSDSCALAQHCVAGWETSRPAPIPTARTLDLRQASSAPHGRTQTLQEAHQEAKSLSRNARLFALPPGERLPHRETSRGRLTQDLLNTSHSLRYSLQQMEAERPAAKPAPHSTAYPAF